MSVGTKSRRQLRVLDRLYDRLKSCNLRLEEFNKNNPSGKASEFERGLGYENTLWRIQDERRTLKAEILRLSRKFGQSAPTDIDCLGLPFWSSAYVIPS